MEQGTDLEYLSTPKQGIKIANNKIYLYINSTRGIYAENRLTSEDAINLARQLLIGANQIS
tara:strand:- start:1189 stop:1371 length:183 start_codon:yes stop_codon:yes gene_type:complete